MTSRTIRIEYSATGNAYTDAAVPGLIMDLIQNTSDVYINVGTENVVHAMRAAIVRKMVKASDVVFVYEGEELYPSEGGRLPSWPIGFCSFMDDCIFVIVGE